MSVNHDAVQVVGKELSARKPVIEGWTWRLYPFKDVKAHYFRNGRALCKPILVDKIDPCGDEIEERDRCRACRRSLRREVSLPK